MQNSTPPAIGQILRNLRKSHKIPLAVLAKDTGVSEATLSRIENGQTAAPRPRRPCSIALPPC
ncbi:MAG: helix-turn-helix transcriptional regulator [Alphaproteobacteria bacterium]|nr:helix-turn-helix transcriptional regulator [Alphaproteobacteria bacterium]